MLVEAVVQKTASSLLTLSKSIAFFIPLVASVTTTVIGLIILYLSFKIPLKNSSSF